MNNFEFLGICFCKVRWCYPPRVARPFRHYWMCVCSITGMDIEIKFQIWRVLMNEWPSFVTSLDIPLIGDRIALFRHKGCVRQEWCGGSFTTRPFEWLWEVRFFFTYMKWCLCFTFHNSSNLMNQCCSFFQEWLSKSQRRAKS